MHEVTSCIFVGIDWGTETHQICILNFAGQIVTERTVPHSATAVTQFLDWLLTIAPQPVSMLIAIEIPHGAFVEELLARSFRVFSLNPKQLDRFRDRHFPAIILGWELRRAPASRSNIADLWSIRRPSVISI